MRSDIQLALSMPSLILCIALSPGMAKGGYSKPPLELKILENPPPLEKFWNTPLWSGAKRRLRTGFNKPWLNP